MEYNTQRTQLQLPEYGRMIQSLVERCKTIEDKKERTEFAYAVVEFMRQRNALSPNGATEPEKLWDHLFILADFDLDVDTPYEAPKKEVLMAAPKPLSYPVLQGEYKFYGKSILQLIDIAISLEEGEEKEALIEVIANNMKKSYNIYNKEHVQDSVIFKHLKELSGNRLDLTGIESLEKSKIYNSHNGQKNKNHRNASSGGYRKYNGRYKKTRKS